MPPNNIYIILVIFYSFILYFELLLFPLLFYVRFCVTVPLQWEVGSQSWESDYYLRHVCLSVCLHGTRLPLDGFSWNLISEYFFRKAAENSLVALKSHKNYGYCVWRTIHILIKPCSVLLTMRNISDKSCRENQNTQFMFNISFFFEYRAVY